MQLLMSLATRHKSSAVWLCALSAVLWSTCAWAQFAPPASQPAAAPTPTAPPAAPLPEPIYWKHDLFLIPYQWSSAADPSAAQAVWLLVSKDRGASWQKISEARPQVKAFNYRAEGDGEYWFAIRTIDRNGRPLPTEPYQPELRVIVDTSMPRIEGLAVQYGSDGALQIQTHASDTNLDSASWKFEVQLDASETWQPLAGVAMTSDGQATWQPPAGARPRTLRATVYDRAGNSAAFGAAIPGTPIDTVGVGAAANAVLPTTVQGWVSASDVPPSTSQSVDASTPQSWPAGAIARTPFRLSDGAAPAPGDQVTSYGNPRGVGTPLVVRNSFANPETQTGSNPTASQGAVTVAPRGSARDNSPTPNITPLEPFRETNQTFRHASLTRLPAVDGTSSDLLSYFPAVSHPATQLPRGI